MDSGAARSVFSGGIPEMFAQAHAEKEKKKVI